MQQRLNIITLKDIKTSMAVVVGSENKVPLWTIKPHKQTNVKVSSCFGTLSIIFVVCLSVDTFHMNILFPLKATDYAMQKLFTGC